MPKPLPTLVAVPAMILWSASIARESMADVHHVPLDGNIQEAIDQAEPGDTVQLGAGTYEVASIQLRAEIELRGAPLDGLRFGTEPQTTILGGLMCPNSGETILRDLKVTNATGTCLRGDPTDGGLVEGCWFVDSKAAIVLIRGTWLFEDCIIKGNGPGGQIPGAGSCGAVGLHIGPTAATQETTFLRCKFENNASGYGGGAIRCLWGGLTILECEFRGNRANRGAAIDLNQTMQPVLISDSVFEHNVCIGSSGAIDSQMNVGRVIRSSTFRSNYAYGGRADLSGGIYPEYCAFNTCCTVDPTAAFGYGNIWTHASVEVEHASCLLCRGDFNCNGNVGSDDLGALLGGWASNDARYDLDEDGVVGAVDLGNLLAQWGDCP